MAKQVGHIKLSGTIDGINYYIMNGVGYSRAAGGGFTRNAIKKSRRMDSVRDNNTEFGHVSAVKKMFKNSLMAFYGPQKDVFLHRAMVSAFFQVKEFDLVNARGQRNCFNGFQNPEGRKFFRALEFAKEPLVFRDANYAAESLQFTAALHPADLPYRNGATHVELQFGLVVMDFDAMKARLFAGDPLRVAKGSPLTELQLSPATPVTGTGIRIAVLWHRYLKEELDGELYPLKDKAVYGLKVLDV